MRKMQPKIYHDLQNISGQNKDRLLKTIFVPKYHRDTKNDPKNSTTPTKENTEKLDQFVRYIQQSLPGKSYVPNPIISK
jgi:hypothetical protein